MMQYATPGVYIKERNAFTNSVVAVPTAVPAFIGYTEKALNGNSSLRNMPTRVSSMSEFVTFFGGAPRIQFNLKAKGNLEFDLRVDKPTQYLLYNSMRLFYANGGGTCYIVSVGDYTGGVNYRDLNDNENNSGLNTLLTEQEPTLICSPDATLLPKAECMSFYQDVLKHCGYTMKSRFGIFDVYDGDQKRSFDKVDVITTFREGVGNNFLNFGAAYYPWLNTTIVTSSETSYKNVSNTPELIKILTAEAEQNYLQIATAFEDVAEAPEGAPDEKAKPDDKVKKVTTPASRNLKNYDERSIRLFEAAKFEIDKLKDNSADTLVLDNTLRTISPLYKTILNSIKEAINILPAAAAMAGIYTLVDNTSGVHKAPANISMYGVTSPTIPITAENQEDLNLPINGKAINAIRTFIGKGILVWGARTLDGNSQDWRYINVRRTMIMLEQSIKSAVENYVFDPNTAQTWVKIRTSIENFLTLAWRSGALVGNTTGDAFEVHVGLGITMTPQDILEGLLRVLVRVAVSRPAEFIEITFEQKLQETGGFVTEPMGV